MLVVANANLSRSKSRKVMDDVMVTVMDDVMEDTAVEDIADIHP